MASKQLTAGGSEQSNADVLRAQHAIIYSKSTSDIKDELPALVAALRAGHGPLSRQEAAFLLYYHVMDGPDKQLELVQAGLVNVCLGLLDAPASDVAAPERTCAAGILTSLCEGLEVLEAVAKGRVGNTTACTILHQLLQEQRDNLQVYAAKCLHLLAAAPMAKAVLLRSMDSQLLFHTLYFALLRDCPNPQVVTHLAMYLAAIINKRDDLRAEAVEGGLVEATLEALQKHKKDSAIQALLQLLLSLLEDRDSWSRLVGRRGIPVLVDLLGPPPKIIQDLEMQQHRALLDPHWAAAQALVGHQETKEQSGAADATVVTAEEAALDKVGTQSPRPNTLISLQSDKARMLHPFTSQKTKGPLALDIPTSDTIPAVSSTTTALGSSLPGSRYPTSPTRTRALSPEVDMSSLLSVNQSGLKWCAITSLQTHCLAAGCLYWLAQDATYMRQMSDRLATSRLIPLLHQAMGGNEANGKKKSKAKGLNLSSEQTRMLVDVTGCLKFLSLMNPNRYRIAALGAVKPLSILYQQCSHTLLRRNAQVILTNIAMLGENGQLLLDGGLPEEFLVPRPLRLSPPDALQLKQEFPDAAFLKASTAPAAPGTISAAVVRIA